MQSRGDTDLPYWPSQNTYVYKEVWVHPSARWLWLMEDLVAPPDSGPPGTTSPEFHLTTVRSPDGTVRLRLVDRGAGAHTFSLRTDNLHVIPAARRVTLRAGRDSVVEWTARVVAPDAPWVAVAIADGDARHRREVFGAAR
jgi:hypothetical protein